MGLCLVPEVCETGKNTEPTTCFFKKLLLEYVRIKTLAVLIYFIHKVVILPARSLYNWKRQDLMTNSVRRKTYGLHNHYIFNDVAWTESFMACRVIHPWKLPYLGEVSLTVCNMPLAFRHKKRQCQVYRVFSGDSLPWALLCFKALRTRLCNSNCSCLSFL